MDNIICIYVSLSCEILNKITNILFLNIGNKIDAKFKVIQLPNLIIISPLFVPKKEYISVREELVFGPDGQPLRDAAGNRITKSWLQPMVTALRTTLF